MSKKPTVLMILDGYGLNDNCEANAVCEGKTPVMDQLMSQCPFVKGQASGLAVGLPEGQMGNSEVGHLNMGAGRICIPGTDPYHQVYSGRRLFPGAGIFTGGGELQKERFRPSHVGTGFRRRRPQPQYPYLRPAGTGKEKRPVQSVCALLPGRPGYASRVRQRLRGRTGSEDERDRRRQSGLGYGPYYAMDRGQPLGPVWNGHTGR